MKRRYSNFHRARKYLRKYQNAYLRPWRRSLASKYGELYEKYDTAAYYLDGVNTGRQMRGHVLDRENDRLIILAHFDPQEVTSSLAEELKYKKTENERVELVTHGVTDFQPMKYSDVSFDQAVVIDRSLKEITTPNYDLIESYLNARP